MIKNIRIVSANGNISYARRLSMYGIAHASLFIHIDYDSLNDINKSIAEELYRNNLVDISTEDIYGGIKKINNNGKNNARRGKRSMFDVDNSMKKCK